MLIFSNTANKQYKDNRKMLKELVHLTSDCVKNSLAVDVVGDVGVFEIAQPMNVAMKIAAVIA